MVANLPFFHIKKNILLRKMWSMVKIIINWELLKGSIRSIKEEEEVIIGHLGFDISCYMRGWEPGSLLPQSPQDGNPQVIQWDWVSTHFPFVNSSKIHRRAQQWYFSSVLEGQHIMGADSWGEFPISTILLYQHVNPSLYYDKVGIIFCLLFHRIGCTLSIIFYMTIFC